MGGKIGGYRDLQVWRRAMDLAEATYRLSRDFPTEEKFGLISQMRRAAVSVAANIGVMDAAVEGLT